MRYIIMKCKHENIEIIEYGSMNTAHARSDDGTWDSWSDVGSYSGKLRVFCPDCNYNREFNKYSKDLPSWIKKHLSDLGIIDMYNGALV